MKLTKSMLKIFKLIIHKGSTLRQLAKEMKKSVNWTSEIVSDLEREGFVAKGLSDRATRSRITFHVAETEYALKLRDLIIAEKTIHFEEILQGNKLLFLAALSEDWISLKEAANLSGVSSRMIATYFRKLLHRGIIRKEKTLYKMNEKAWPLLFQFVRSYKNHSTINGFVKWRFQDEILFQVDEEEFVQGTITGMNRYEDFGVKVWNVSALCHLPQRKLNKKEIFIHSLFEVDDPRTLHLAMTFYLKNKLKKEKIFLLAMRYGKYTMFKNMLKLFDVKEESLKLEGLPTFDRIDFYRIATMYDIKGLENPGKYKLQKKRGF